MTKLPSRLLSGHQKYLELQYDKLASSGDDVEQRPLPEILVIAGCDVKIAPELIFGAKPDELIVLRYFTGFDVSTGTNSEYDAIIEYAVRNLMVKHILVLGHKSIIQEQHVNSALHNSSSSQMPTSKADSFDICKIIKKLRELQYIRDHEDNGILSLHGAIMDSEDLSLVSVDVDGESH